MMIRTGPWTSEQHVRDMGATPHHRLPGHLGNIIPGGLVRGDSLGAGKPTKPVRVNDAAIRAERRVASEERRRAAKQVSDAAYRLRHLEDIRAKDRARKAPR